MNPLDYYSFFGSFFADECLKHGSFLLDMTVWWSFESGRTNSCSLLRHMLLDIGEGIVLGFHFSCR